MFGAHLPMASTQLLKKNKSSNDVEISQSAICMKNFQKWTSECGVRKVQMSPRRHGSQVLSYKPPKALKKCAFFQRFQLLKEWNFSNFLKGCNKDEIQREIFIL